MARCRTHVVRGGATAGETKERLAGAASVQRWKELGLIGYRSDVTDPETHSRRLCDIHAAQGDARDGRAV
jgi:hypothetical protein